MSAPVTDGPTHDAGTLPRRYNLMRRPNDVCMTGSGGHRLHLRPRKESKQMLSMFLELMFAVIDIIAAVTPMDVA